MPHNYQLGFYTEQYLATQFLGHGDVFERFPELKIVVCHCGGGLDRFHKSDPHLPQKDLSQNLFFDTCAYESLFLEAAIKQRGVERIVFGSEAPGSGRHIIPETGRSGDDPVVPVLDWVQLPSARPRRFRSRTGIQWKVFPAMAKWDVPVKQAVTTG